MNMWPMKPLGDVADIVRGVSFKKGDVSNAPLDGYIPVLRAGNIQDQLETERDLVYVSQSFISGDQLMQRGDVAICMSSGSAAIVGKTARLKHDWIGSVGAFCAIVRFRNGMLPNFGAYWFKSPEFIQWRDANAKGANIQNLRRGELERLLVPVPPLAEQERIVRLLDEADAIRKLRARANQRAADLVPALFHEMFGECNYQRRPIGEVTLLVTSGSTPKGGSATYLDEGPMIIRSQNVRMNRLDLSDVARISDATFHAMRRVAVQPQDVLLNITGASIGRVARVGRAGITAVVNQHVCIIRPNQHHIHSVYLSIFLSLPSSQTHILGIQAGASRQALNHKQVRALDIPLPPLSTQETFVEKFNDILTLQDLQVRSLEALTASHSSLIQLELSPTQT